MSKKKPLPKKPMRHRAPRLMVHRVDADELPVRVFVEVLTAIHLSSYVKSDFSDRGGLIIVGPPGVWKTTLLNIVDTCYHDALHISDLNVPTLNELKDQIAAGGIRSLVIGELAKLYERDPRTASHLEGTLRALVCEGFRKPSFEDARISTLTARCMVLTAITTKFQTEKYRHWENSGFGRRFLFPLIRMKDPHLLDKAVEDGKKIELRLGRLPPIPPEGVIPDTTTTEERREMRPWLKRQPGGGVHNLQQLVLVRSLAVLKWWYGLIGRPPREAMNTMRVFARSLKDGGAELTV